MASHTGSPLLATEAIGPFAHLPLTLSLASSSSSSSSPSSTSPSAPSADSSTASFHPFAVDYVSGAADASAAALTASCLASSLPSPFASSLASPSSASSTSYDASAVRSLPAPADVQSIGLILHSANPLCSPLLPLLPLLSLPLLSPSPPPLHLRSLPPPLLFLASPLPRYPFHVIDAGAPPSGQAQGHPVSICHRRCHSCLWFHHSTTPTQADHSTVGWIGAAVNAVVR